MSDFIAGHEIAIQDTGAPRGERNYWRVLLNGQSIYEGHNGAQAQRTYRAVSEGLKRAAQPAAGEPVAYCDDFTLEKLKSNLAYSVGVTPAAQRYPDDVHALYVGQPAAAHGDEAVLDVLKAAYESGYQDGQDAPNAYSDEKVKHRIALSLLEEMVADATMRAQGDGENGDG